MNTGATYAINSMDTAGFNHFGGAIGDGKTVAIHALTQKFGSCFAAGTLVHTKEGLVPIEQVKVGDYVLSKHDSGMGEQAYKRVLQTFFYPSETVMAVGHVLPGEPNKTAQIITTLNHPFWLAEVRSEDDQPGWTAASRLSKGWRNNGDKFLLANGDLAVVSGCDRIYVSAQEGVGWHPSYMSDRQREGYLVDYRIHPKKMIAIDVLATRELRDYDEEHLYHPIFEVPDHFLLKLPVYNLEVEDFHTYYVGKYGVWVHNQNCGGLRFEQQPSLRE